MGLKVENTSGNVRQTYNRSYMKHMLAWMWTVDMIPMREISERWILKQAVIMCIFNHCKNNGSLNLQRFSSSREVVPPQRWWGVPLRTLPPNSQTRNSAGSVIKHQHLNNYNLCFITSPYSAASIESSLTSKPVN